MDQIYFSMFFPTEHFNHFRQQLFCFVCSIWSIHIRYCVSLLFPKCHILEMIPLQGHSLLEADKLISLFHVGSSLKARQFRKQTLSLSTVFAFLWLFHWCSTFKGFCFLCKDSSVFTFHKARKLMDYFSFPLWCPSVSLDARISVA